MSISSEISRISGNVSDAFTAISAKGVTVPQGSNSDDLATLIGSIQTGGGGTAHTIYFEFSDGTDTTITGHWDSSFISDAIRATTPSTYGGKAVTLAQLDGAAWYEPAAIPLNTQLIDFSKVKGDYVIYPDGSESAEQWYACSDYTPIASGMTFEYRGCRWFYAAYYDSTKTFISSFYIDNDKTSVSQDNSNVGIGVLSTGIPANAAYIRISSVGNPDDSMLSLIRTA